MKLMKVSLFVLPMLVMTQVSFGYHRVTEKLPNGKLLICGHQYQKRSGNKVETYIDVAEIPERLVKNGEFYLPKAGDKVKLIFSHLESKDKFQDHEKIDKVGEATIVETNLTGAARLVLVSRKNGYETKIIKISEQESNEIKSNCLIADSGPQSVDVGTKVEYY